MENSQVSILSAETSKLFCLFDKKGIGLISKKTLLVYLAMIDPQINEEWLNKILIQKGKKLPSFLTCKDLIKLIKEITQSQKQSPNNQ